MRISIGRAILLVCVSMAASGGGAWTAGNIGMHPLTTSKASSLSNEDTDTFMTLWVSSALNRLFATNSGEIRTILKEDSRALLSDEGRISLDKAMIGLTESMERVGTSTKVTLLSVPTIVVRDDHFRYRVMTNVRLTIQDSNKTQTRKLFVWLDINNLGTISAQDFVIYSVSFQEQL